MSEEQEQKPAETNVEVSEKDMESINQEIDKVESTKLDEAKKEGYQEAVKDSTIEQLKKELEEIKRSNEEAAAKAAEEEEKRRLEAELNAEKARAEEVRKKHFVPQASNPTVAEKQEPEQDIRIDPGRAMDELEIAVRKGEFRATYSE